MKRRHKKQIFPLLIAGLRPPDRSSPFLPNSLPLWRWHAPPFLPLLPPLYHLPSSVWHPHRLPALQTFPLHASSAHPLSSWTPPTKLCLSLPRGRSSIPSTDGTLHGCNEQRRWGALHSLLPCWLPPSPLPSPSWFCFPCLLLWWPGRDGPVARPVASRGDAEDG